MYMDVRTVLLAKFGANKGMSIKKPWSVAINVSSMRSALHRTCDKTHEHAPCAGKDTSMTEGYTDELVNTVHKALSQYCAQLDSEGSPESITDCALEFAMPCIECVDSDIFCPQTIRTAAPVAPQFCPVACGPF